MLQESKYFEVQVASAEFAGISSCWIFIETEPGACVSDINCCWFSIELDCIILPLFLLKTLNIGFSLNCFIMFHFRITVIKVYAILFKAAVHFHDRPSKFFSNASTLQVEAVGIGIMGSYNHLLPFIFLFFRLSGIRIWWVAISLSFGCLNLYYIWYIFYCLLTLGLFSWDKASDTSLPRKNYPHIAKWHC